MRKRMFFLLAIVLSLAMAATAAHAATYYVSTTGNDGNGGTSYGDAWASINNGDSLGILNPGDTVMVAPGTYTPPDANGIVLANNSGAAGNPITYKADGSGVIIDNSGALSPSGLSPEVHGYRVQTNYTVIDGFEITNATIGILAMPPVGLEVKNNVIHDLAPQDMFPGATGVYFGGGANNNSVHHNTFYNIDGGIGTGTAIMDSTYTTIINNNLIYNIVGDIRWGKGPAGIVLRGGDNDEVYNNTIVGSWAGILAVGDIGLSSAVVNNNIIQDMLAYGMVMTDQGTPSILTADYNLFWNCADTYDGTTAGLNDILADPMLDGSYRLLAGSPAIDTGIDVGLPYYGAAPDIGAFEYIPEPTSILALASGLVCLGGIIRRRR